MRLLRSARVRQSVPEATADLVFRAFAGLSMALAHGLGKVPPSEAFTQGVAELGFPAPALFAWCAAAAELLGGLGLALGALTRLSAGSVAFTMIVAAFGRHASDPYRMKELSLLYLAIALFFLIAGAGRYSVDAWLATRKR